MIQRVTVFELEYDEYGLLQGSTDAGGAYDPECEPPPPMAETVTDPLGSDYHGVPQWGNLMTFTDAAANPCRSPTTRRHNVTATDGNGDVVS